MLLTLMATTLLAQNGPPAVTGSVSGRVFDADTNLPIVGVKVSAVPEDRRSDKSATTDSEGRYVIPNLPIGKRSIEVYDGNLGTSMTARQWVTVSDNRNIQVDFHTRLFAQVSGRVLDDDGNPLEGIQVTANRKEYEDYTGGDRQSSRIGQVQLVPVSARALTDDQGRYVISTLPAGRQYWIVANRPRRDVVPISDSPADPQLRRRTLAATYYPNANSIDAAASIRVHSQEVRNDVDIRMSKTESYCLEATLTEAGVPTGMQFLLVDKAVSSTRLPSVSLPRSFQSGSDGKIRLCDLYPGQYQLVAARLSGAAQESIAAVDVTITNKDVRDLIVAAIPRTTVSGELVLDKQAIEGSTPSIRVQTYPSPVRQFPPFPVLGPGSFSLDVVVGSSYIAAISGLDSHSYVKDVQYGGSSILYQPFVPSPGDAKLIVTIGSDAGSISAKVLSANGEPVSGSAVLIVPVTARTEPEVAVTFRAGLTDENGTHLETGLRPGRYDIFAITDPPPSIVDRGDGLLIDRTPEAVGKILSARSRGKQVDVRPGGAAAVLLVPFRMD